MFTSLFAALQQWIVRKPSAATSGLELRPLPAATLSHVGGAGQSPKKYW